jgi:glucose/arabinose dehydrogenase
LKSKFLMLAATSTLIGAIAPAYAQRGLDPTIQALRLTPNIVPGCGVAGRRVTADLPPVGKPLEQRPPVNPLTKPNFPGQTRAPYVKTKTPITEKVIASGLERAWKIQFMADGRMLITERPGRIRIVTQQGQMSDPIAGVPTARSAANPQGTVLNFSDAGFLDVVLDPDFATNRKVYWTFVEIRPNGNGTTLQSAVLSQDEKSFSNITTIYQAPAWVNAGHYGGKLLVTPDRKLLMTYGERIDWEKRIEAQSIQSPLGKILRMNLDGTAPPDNPLSKLAEAEPRIWAMGLRNNLGLAYDSRGRLWGSEIGPLTADEINIIEKGGNYGWPLATHGQDACGQHTNGGATSYPGTIQPIYYWDPTTAPSGIAFYNGKLVPEWQGNLFVAHLAGGHVSRLVLKGDRVVGEERFLVANEQRVRDVAMGPDGAIWALTDSAITNTVSSRLIRIAPTGK